MRQLDWKVVVLALFACYAVPASLFEAAMAALVPVAQHVTGWRLLVTSLLLVAFLVAPPFSAGYFTARFARNRPQLHVLLVVCLGFFVFMLESQESFVMSVAIGVASFALAVLGATAVLRRGPA